jgi:lysine 2,3-aminomutase
MNKLASIPSLWPELVSQETRALMDAGDPADPIARQYAASPDELSPGPGALGDPIGDAAHSPLPGLVHRHADRVLLMPTEACAVHCRFCFRREALAEPRTLGDAELDAALAYVRAKPQIREAILTGGDPLVLSLARLARLVAALDGIAHLSTIRVHSRVPIAEPSRVTPELVAACRAGKAFFLAVHCNHPRELSRQAVAACRRFLDAGIPVLAQTVLLRGVNDDADTLAGLMEALVAARIKPYYLHQCDLAPGTAHFRVPLPEGRALMAELRRRVSGLALPAYVLDIPGGHGKVPLEGSHGPDREGRVMDAFGRRHRYPPE